jgi:tRNA (guanine-N7-)-methyltransferase
MSRAMEKTGDTDETRAAPDGLQRLWGRHKAFALRPRQQALFETLLPRLALQLPADAAPGSFDPRKFFEAPSPCPLPASGERVNAPSPTPRLRGEGRGEGASPRSISLEIGFGGGEHLIAWAKLHPAEGFIGAEPFVNGMGKMLAHLDDEKLENVRLYAGDARRLVEALKPESLARVFLLFPDPWPKKRHWKRRYVQDETLGQLARVIEDGGMLRIASDIPHYIAWTLERAARRPEFVAVHEGAGWRARPADWPPTRYEQKAVREGRVPAYLEFIREPR